MENGQRKAQRHRAITSSASVAVSCIILKPSPTFSSMVTSRMSLGKMGGLSLTSCSVISTCGGRINSTLSIKVLPTCYSLSATAVEIAVKKKNPSESSRVSEDEEAALAGKFIIFWYREEKVWNYQLRVLPWKLANKKAWIFLPSKVRVFFDLLTEQVTS